MSDSIMVSLFDRDDLVFVENEKGQFIHTDEIEKLDSEYLLKISQLEKENAELKCQLDEIKRHIPKIGETLKLTEKDKLIAELKEELMKEQKIADFYELEGNFAYCASNEWIEEVGSAHGYYNPFGERARQRIKERKELNGN